MVDLEGRKLEEKVLEVIQLGFNSLTEKIKLQTAHWDPVRSRANREHRTQRRIH